MGKPKTPSTQTTTTKTEPYLKNEVGLAAGRAGDLYNKGAPAYFPGATYVPFSGATENALSMTENRAMNGSPLSPAASALALGNLRGDYLNGNPYVDQMVAQGQGDIANNFSSKVLPGISSNFASSGRYGSGLQQATTIDALKTAANEAAKVGGQIRYQNYDNERNRQMLALNQYPALAQADYADAQALAGVGSAREALSQAKLQDEIDRFNYTANADQNALDTYITRIGALNSGSGTATVTNPTAKRGGGFGGALSGAIGGATSLGPLIGSGIYGAGIAGSTPGLAALGGPWGLGIGAGLGLLGGLFG